MNRLDIGNRIKKILSEHLGHPVHNVTPNANIIDDLGADSLDAVEIVMAIEDEFGIEIPDEDLNLISTPSVQIIIGMVDHYLNGTPYLFEMPDKTPQSAILIEATNKETTMKLIQDIAPNMHSDARLKALRAIPTDVALSLTDEQLEALVIGINELGKEAYKEAMDQK